MIYIAHRGLVDGPDTEKENHPEQIQFALNQGFDCEIDLRVIADKLMLGHDNPQYHVGQSFLYKPGLWIHCKNYPALIWCSRQGRLNYFWHDTDAYTLTSLGFIWAYPGQPTGKGYTVQVMPEISDPTLKNIEWSNYAVCSDYILKIQAQKPKSLI